MSPNGQQGYVPNVPRPFKEDITPNLEAILREVKHGCAHHESVISKARELTNWYEGDSERYLPMRPSEDSLSWITRPHRISFITRKVIDRLTSHLYKPGPRQRSMPRLPLAGAWYQKVVQDIHLSAVMHEADILATLHGMCAIGIYSTGSRNKPINYHLYPRQDFAFWTSPDDPRVAVAVCTITKMTNDDTTRYRVFTSSHFYTFYKGKSWGYRPGGWGTARFDDKSSGSHNYGALPFVFITHKIPTTSLETRGIGYLVAKINRALNTDKSNLAHWVHHYARPLGFVSGVGPEWRPKFTDGGFVPLVVRTDSTEANPVVPRAEYLESSFDVASVREYIIGEANQALDELGVPVTITTNGGESSANGMSGLGIAAMDADLITYAKGRKPLFELHESRIAALACGIGARALSGVLSGGSEEDANLAFELGVAAADPSLRVSWPSIQIDLPGQERDIADGWELDRMITDPIEVLMHRQGYDEGEAIKAYISTRRRRKLVEDLEADPSIDPAVSLAEGGMSTDDALSLIDGSVEDQSPPERTEDEEGNEILTPDMGIEEEPRPDVPANDAAVPNLTLSVGIMPNEPIPSGHVLDPFGKGGTES